MSETKIKNSKIENNTIKPHKHILINDAGIGSNRIEMSNHYLNYFNSYRKNMIKMSRILELRNIERKKKLEKFRKEKEIPGLMFSSAYYKYSGNDYEYFENDKNNVAFKNAKINYLQDLINNDKKTLKMKSNDNKNMDSYIYKSLKISEDLIKGNLTKEEKKFVNKNKIFNYKQRNELKIDDDLLYLKTNTYLIKSKNIKCRIIFGKTLNNDSEHHKKENTQKRSVSYRNKKIGCDSFDINSHNQKSRKEDKSTNIKMKLLHKNKLLPLIK